MRCWRGIANRFATHPVKVHRAVVCEHFAAWKYVVLPYLRHLMIGRALQAWRACANRSAQVQAAKDAFLLKAKHCLLLSVLTEWYRRSAALHFMLQQRNARFLRLILQELRSKFHMKFNAM